MITRRLLPVLAAVAALVCGTAVDAGARPGGPITVPGGLRPNQTLATGTCEMSGVTCRPSNPPRTACVARSNPQTTPPASIRVFLGASRTIVPVPFKEYVENVLPNEWLSSWDGDALKAGAVAIKSYAWYWANHFGGYLGNDPTDPTKCFDVTDDADFQVYKAGTATDRTNEKVEQSWPVVARRNGQVIQAFYLSYLHNSGETCGAYANGTTMSQYGTQACNEANTGNKYNVILAKYYYPGLQLATPQQRRTPHDFTFTQTSTKVTYSAGRWTIDDGYPTIFQYGASTDKPVITDQGDGFAHIGLYRPSDGTWHLASPTGTTAQTITYGARTDIPVAGHWNGIDQPSVIAVFRPSDGTWHVRGQSAVQYGKSGDVPVPGDYDGNGTTGIALFRPGNGTWYIRGGQSVQYGQRGDVPAPADYNGDGKTDIALYRPSTHTFYVRGITSVHYGVSGDIPVTGDFTGDGKADFSVYRPSTHIWYVHGQPSEAVGSGSATPIGAAPYRG